MRSIEALAQRIPESEDPKVGGSQNTCAPVARATCKPRRPDPPWKSSHYSEHMWCKFGPASFTGSACSACRNFMQGSTGSHVARGTWRRSTRDGHHRRSGVPVHPVVPPPSRSHQPFGLHNQKCLNRQTDPLTHTQTQFANFGFRPLRQFKSPAKNVLRTFLNFRFLD